MKLLEVMQTEMKATWMKANGASTLVEKTALLHQYRAQLRTYRRQVRFLNAMGTSSPASQSMINMRRH